MLQNIHSILTGLIKEGDPEEAYSALTFGLSLTREAGHVTVQAASLKLVLTHAFISEIAAWLAAAETWIFRP